MAKRTEHGTVNTAPPISRTADMQSIADQFNDHLPIHPEVYPFSGGRVFREVNFYELSLSELEDLV